ncbi:MAG: MBL fold metallo-hydrolase [Spirochaetales bacterium]|nr:MBL fold metallo-hydrolase [Spirochaetales bacterium]
MKLTFLGTGTSHGIPVIGCRCPVCTSTDPKNKRTRSSLLVEDTIEGINSKILIDTAPEFRLQALSAGLTSLRAVLYTHAHADHLHGIDDLRSFGGETPVGVYGAEETLAEIKKRFPYIFEIPLQEGGGIPRLALTPIQPGPFRAGGFPCTAIPLKHGKLNIFGYRFGPAAYITDCSHIPASARTQLEGLEVLIINGLRPAPHQTHFSIGEALAEIARLKPTRAYLTHFNHEVDHETIKKELPEGTAPSYDGLTVVL